MNSRFASLFVSTTLFFAAFWCAPALAQEPTGGYRQPGFYGASEQVGEEVVPDNGEHEFSWFTMTPGLGYAYFPSGSLSAGDIAGVGDLDLKIDSRNAFVAKLEFAFGGDGIAVEMIPFLAVEAGGSGFSAASVDLGGGTGATKSDQYYAIGGQGHLVYRWQAGVFYPHIGLGGHLAYLMSSDVDYGAEVYGRLPLGFTVYLLDNLGLVLEGALMLGVTGIKRTFEPQDIANSIAAEVDIDPTTLENANPEAMEAQAQQMVADEISKKINFGFGIAWDISIGIRFP